ncbi:MAG: Ig-like domain-containing protein, partial [SAR324 cluster bacterium]|nr:Ig-like domain-containing protein [SAR324 cluster bacterium]
MCAKFSSKQIAGGSQMFSSSKFNSFFALVVIPPIIFLSSCGERSEYGKRSDYEKLGYNNGIRPTISSVSPIDNSTDVSVSTTVAVTFSKKMSTSSITTNTSDTTCSGSFQLSSDNFSTCIKMSANPVASDNDTTFTATPASTLIAAKTFKTRVTDSVKDTASNSLASAYTTNGFTTACSWSTDVTVPTVSSESPTDNSTYNSPATTVAVTFSENMATESVTTNTSDTTCSGSFQLSSDNFTTCIKMSAAPVASDNDTIFTITPASSLSAA